jgi:hypothetical protein
MFSRLKKANTQPDFTTAWLIIAIMVVMQSVYIIICHQFGTQIQQALNIEQRIFIRTLLYVVAIATFPLTTLLRYILVRLNQTMPGEKTASQRYFITVLISQAMMESIGIFGFVMYILGDDFNTLYIFSGLAVLGFFLQRPKPQEYQSIIEMLEHQQ